MKPNLSRPPPYTFKPSEPDSLMLCNAPQRRSGSLYRSILTVLLTATVVAGIFALVFPLSSCNDPLDPDVRDRIRHEWELERRQHQEEVLKRIDIERHWQVEDDERDHLREQWLREAEEHERNLSEAIRCDNQEKEARLAELEREMERYAREMWECKRCERVCERREREWEMQDMVWEWREREWERREREREGERRERLELDMSWTDPESHECTAYGTRRYTARLVNVPENYDHRVEACLDIPIKIQGAEYKAMWCGHEDEGSSNLIGHWTVDEPDCASYWNGYKDLGCGSPGSGQRHVEHHLENLPSGDDYDWKEFCDATPASFLGMHFMGAHFCSKTVSGAVYGHWVFDDESCN